MADLDPSIGYLAVFASLTGAIADSDDAGERPDSVPRNGTVAFWTEGIPPSRPYVVHAASEQIITLPMSQFRPIYCRLVNGRLIPPENGWDGRQEEEIPEAEVGLKLVAPKQASIDYTGWVWVADFTPTPSETSAWPKFQIRFTGEPGDVKQLALAALAQPSASSERSPTVWTVTVPEGGDPMDYIPAGAKPGEVLLDLTTGNFYRIGA